MIFEKGIQHFIHQRKAVQYEVVYSSTFTFEKYAFKSNMLNTRWRPKILTKSKLSVG